MGISRQAYYKRNRAYDARASHAQKVLGFVLETRLQMPRLGTRKLHGLMQFVPRLMGTVGRERLFDILRDSRQLVPRKRAYHKITD